MAQGVSLRISLHPHAIHDVTCLSVRLLSLRVCLSLVSLPLLPFLFHSLPVFCPAHQLPQCRHRRGLKPLYSRTMRSSAPWRYTILSHMARSWCNSPSAPARWSESGRMADSAPITGYEPKLANFSSYTDLGLPSSGAIRVPLMFGPSRKTVCM